MPWNSRVFAESFKFAHNWFIFWVYVCLLEFRVFLLLIVYLLQLSPRQMDAVTRKQTMPSTSLTRAVSKISHNLRWTVYSRLRPLCPLGSTDVRHTQSQGFAQIWPSFCICIIFIWQPAKPSLNCCLWTKLFRQPSQISPLSGTHGSCFCRPWSSLVFPLLLPALWTS